MKPAKSRRLPERARRSIAKGCKACGHARAHHFRDRGKYRGKDGPKYCHAQKADLTVCQCQVIK